MTKKITNKKTIIKKKKKPVTKPPAKKKPAKKPKALPTVADHGKFLEQNLEAAKKAFKKNQTVTNSKKLSEAIKLLVEHNRVLKNMTSDIKIFVKGEEVFDYLKDENWSVGKSKVFEHINKGFIKKQKDGTFSSTLIDDYASNYLKKIDGSDSKGLTSSLENKTKHEARLAEAKADRAEREEKMAKLLLVSKDEVEKLHAGKLALFLSGIEDLCQGSTIEEAINILGGDASKAEDFQEFLFKEFMKLLQVYAKPCKFTVPMTKVLEAQSLIEEASN